MLTHTVQLCGRCNAGIAHVCASCAAPMELPLDEAIGALALARRAQSLQEAVALLAHRGVVLVRVACLLVLVWASAAAAQTSTATPTNTRTPLPTPVCAAGTRSGYAVTTSNTFLRLQPSSLGSATGLTVAYWAKLGASNEQAIVRQAGHMELRAQGLSNRAQCTVGGTGCNWDVSGFNWADWHHYACTNDGTTTRVYVDGAEVTNCARTYSAGSCSGAGCGNIDIGYQGSFDDVLMWRGTALGVADVEALYNAGAGTCGTGSVSRTNLLVEYKLDDTSGSTTAADDSGNGYTLTETSSSGGDFTGAAFACCAFTPTPTHASTATPTPTVTPTATATPTSTAIITPTVAPIGRPTLRGGCLYVPTIAVTTGG